MSEENKIVEEQAVAETPTQEVSNEVGNLIAESKKYRQRSQSAEAELNELKENLKLQETKQLEEKEEFKSLYEGLKIENEKLKPIVENFEIQENYADPKKIEKNIKWKAKNDYLNVIKKLINKEI